jgi:Sec-independent protein translocase protein TatA
MLRVILWILLGYFVYRFVFNFLLPIFKVSRQMRRQVKEFQNNMHQAQNQSQQQQQPFQQSATAQQRATASPQEKSGDYIDFEEVK